MTPFETTATVLGFVEGMASIGLDGEFAIFSY
jgi:hypothetical protein